MTGKPSERGVALVLVLVILPLVAIIMTQLHFEATIGSRLASNVLANQQFKLAIQARRVQIGGRLMLDLRQDQEQEQQGASFDHYSDDWGPDAEGGGTALVVMKGDAEHGDQVTLYTEVTDEQGKFNLNLLRHTDPSRRERAFEMLRNLLDLYRDGRYGDLADNDKDLSEPEADEVAQAIRKFVRGEERDERVPKSELPNPTDDLRQGVFTVDDLVFSHRLFLEKRLLDRFTDLDSDQVLPGLRDFLTVYGDGKVNANTAPIQVLRAMFKHPEAQESVANAIFRNRGGFLSSDEDQELRQQKQEERDRYKEEGDEEGLEDLDSGYKNTNELGQVEELSNEPMRRRNDIDIGRDFSVRSNFFTIVITAQRDKAMRQHRVVIERHLQGYLTWESEVRLPELIDLPTGAPALESAEDEDA